MFHLFGGSHYYPCGGLDDYLGSYDVLDDAIEAARQTDNEWWHVADDNMQRVADSIDGITCI